MTDARKDYFLDNLLDLMCDAYGPVSVISDLIKMGASDDDLIVLGFESMDILEARCLLE